ncbi:MAG: hypothetical protein IPH05_04845 [Flavobacteriales bacterium]|jgi:hypothetical protein|nr:hypothetical protein [Flavobacteriales bacterium]MBK6882262.1 hypothetical protein [Flavobacteriales bacterium]MBK7101522.1 hypothetical protein [Flavobacteriales bacterium]MBK7112227.1 hypothetical protein [Flavobacteriales bacterium]MBK7481767.1 hypothetical protein [Flavobacteriales bacterium]
MKHAHLLLILAVLCTTACKKDEIDLSSLTSNPFDAEYNGDPIFAMVDQETVEQTISGVVQQRLNVTVSVRSDLFPIATSYQVRAVRGSTTQVFFLNAQDHDRFVVSVAGVSPGDVECWSLQLGNAGEFGGGNDVCGTAE